MKINRLIEDLQALKELCPDADIYFTANKGYSGHEIEFQMFYIDDENNNIEMLFSIEE